MSESASNVFVKFEKVQKSYDGKILVVKDLNLDIEKGEFLTMLGPSGSGKTTCLMMLSGFEPATNGEIYLDGKPINDVPPHKRGIGMVFQNYALFPHMTVAENLAFPLQMRKVPKPDIEKQVKRVLDMVELGDFGGRRPAQLSGGQQQRVAVARAMVFDPELILMDEPLGALDKNLREQMQYEIKHLHEKLGFTVVYVTHDQTEALTMSSRVAVFDDGIIQQLDTPSTLYEAPKNAFVAGFIGENNCLVGQIDALDADTCTVVVDGQPVKAKPVNAASIGKQSTLSLRPERIILNPEAGSLPNIFESEILEEIYLGDHLRLRVKLLGNDKFIIKVKNSPDVTVPKVGEKLTLGWRLDDCRALDA
ncbi:ABC transporter ATP-binding protein [Ostreibacterium oceani]|uniref:Spermidine/putrescine import ATP-binding protein PotA n=1 Tax=Ostreibacterium oceani TaxID=2654998 RepID=A0A6N7ETY7_9GAMM|nr:ABC transporter ATP-binding protein [Ostreibacterium oceani]MPV85423.1 polyamine ABC transporter ATP-binding protein [Ostreibacterium oceani]